MSLNQLRPGTNVWGVMLGKGFYNTAGDRRVHGVNAKRTLGLILQAHIEYGNGTEQVISTDCLMARDAGADHPLCDPGRQ